MEKIENNDYTVCFRNIIFIMKMFAIYPFYPLHEVMNISRLFSTILTITSISIYVWVSVEQQTNFHDHLSNLLENFNFVRLVRFIPALAFRLLFLIAPFLTWNKNKQLRNHRNKWTQFQTRMEKLTGTFYKCSAKNIIHGIFTIGMIGMSVLAVLIKTRQWNSASAFESARIEPDQKKSAPEPTSILSLLHHLNGISNVMTYWVINNIYTISSAKKITDLVQKTIIKGEETDLRHLIDLWILLCDINEEFIDSHSILFLLLFCTITITGVVGGFSTGILFIHFPDKTLGATYFFSTVLCFLFIMMFCEIANSVTDNMISRLRTILLEENLNNKNTKLVQMISLFLETIETKNPRVTLSEYITLDRSMLSSIIGTVVNFLVILKQFSPV